MDREDGRCRGIADEGSPHLLTDQLRLLETKRGEVRILRERGRGSFSYVEALANDLVGIRLVLSAALLAGGIGQAEREALPLGEVRALGSTGREDRP